MLKKAMVHQKFETSFKGLNSCLLLFIYLFLMAVESENVGLYKILSFFPIVLFVINFDDDFM